MKCETHPRTYPGVPIPLHPLEAAAALSGAWPSPTHSSSNLPFQAPAISIFMLEIKGSGIMAKTESPRYGLGSSCFFGPHSC